MTARIFIDGQAGTTGLGIVQRLANLPGISLVQVPTALRKSPAARTAALCEADLAILCLPDDAARESADLAAALGDHAPKLLDTSTAHRTAPGWVYGFAEAAADRPAQIAAATHVANPGCYATGAIALLRPLIAAGLVPPDLPLTINAVSGYSGGGVAMIAEHQAAAGPAFELYGLSLAHKHLPEILAQTGLTRTPIFVPSVAHVERGMIVCIPLHIDLLPPATTPARLLDALTAFYAATTTITVTPADSTARLRIDATNNTDTMDLTIAASADGRAAVLIARLDNLGKGASGAAVQNTKLMLGLPA